MSEIQPQTADGNSNDSSRSSVTSGSKRRTLFRALCGPRETCATCVRAWLSAVGPIVTLGAAIVAAFIAWPQMRTAQRNAAVLGSQTVNQILQMAEAEQQLLEASVFKLKEINLIDRLEPSIPFDTWMRDHRNPAVLAFNLILKMEGISLPYSIHALNLDLNKERGAFSAACFELSHKLDALINSSKPQTPEQQKDWEERLASARRAFGQTYSPAMQGYNNALMTLVSRLANEKADFDRQAASH